MKNNQSGSLIISVALFLVTVAITINMTVDFFRLNSSIQTVTTKTQARIFLKYDLENQAKVTSAIRLSLKDPNNTAFTACVLAGGCSSSSPQGFYLASPMVGNLPIAGTKRSPAYYDLFGERCKIIRPGCENRAYSFYKIEGGELKVWVVAAPSTSVGVPDLSVTPTATFLLSSVLATY